MFINTNSVTLWQTVFLQNCLDVKDKVFENKIAFFLFLSFLCLRQRNRKNKEKLNGKRQNNYKHSVF